MINRSKQSGVALLAFMLILITGASYMLVKKFNANAEVVKREQETHAALMQAKAALIAYAVNYPEMNEKPDRGPGYLPCPDQGANPMPDPLPTTYDESLIDGKKEGNCTAASSSGTTLGLLPYGDLGLTDIRDSSGERLWYAVSQNYKHHQDITYVLNSETPGSIQVDGEDDIVAVIIAPGPPLDFQSGRRGAAEYEALIDSSPRINIVAGQYLESENAIIGGGNEMYTRGVLLESEIFNDQLVVITRRELMQAVEKRVINEARRILAEYYRDNGSYPWLVAHSDPLAAVGASSGIPDPKADARWISGTAGENSSSTELRDGNADFDMAGVELGDTVWNLSDGSWGVVDNVSTNSLELAGDGLAFGSNNVFGVGDEYYIDASGMPEALSGTATAGSTNNVLIDSDKDFSKIEIAPGDILDRLGPSGEILSASQIVRVESDRLIVESVAFAIDQGDNYKIRSNGHIAGAGSSGLTLEDNSVDFYELGVEAGDAIRNLTDQSVGMVNSIESANRLILSGLYGGENNSFVSGDSYSINRLVPRQDIIRGFLPVLQNGEPLIPHSLNIDWRLSGDDGNQVVSEYLADTTNQEPDPPGSTYTNDYIAELRSWIQESDGHSDTISIIPASDSGDASCIWIDVTIINCKLKERNEISGTITSADTYSISDNSNQYPPLSVKRGSRIINSNDGSRAIASIVYENTIDFVNINGEPSFNNNLGEQYSIQIPTNYSRGQAEFLELDNLLVNFSGEIDGAKIGDVVENTDDLSIGIVTSVFPGCCLSHTALQDGSSTRFGVGDNFTIYHNYVKEREYEFNFKMKSSMLSGYDSGQSLRVLTFCNIKDSNEDDCPLSFGVLPNLKEIIGDDDRAVISVTDYDEFDNVIAGVSIYIPISGAMGAVKVSDFTIDFKFIPGLDMPKWFVNNRWYQYIYAGYSEGFSPDAATPACGGGGEPDCLSLNIVHPSDGSVSSNADNQALVIGTGSQSGIQDRAVPRLENYLEGENASLFNALLYEKRFLSAEFNDQIRVVCPDAFYPDPGSLICAP